MHRTDPAHRQSRGSARRDCEADTRHRDSCSSNLPHDTVRSPSASATRPQLARARQRLRPRRRRGWRRHRPRGAQRPDAHPRRDAARPSASCRPARATTRAAHSACPADLAEAALTVLDRRASHASTSACATAIYFNNSFAAGLDAKVTAKAVEYKVTTRRDRACGCTSRRCCTCSSTISSSFPLERRFDGAGPVRLDTLIVAVTNGPTYGGGFYITPDAIADDGLFDVCMIDPLSLPRGARPAALRHRRQAHHDEARAHVTAHVDRRSSATSRVPARSTVRCCSRRRYDISMLPGAIECVVPRTAS